MKYLLSNIKLSFDQKETKLNEIISKRLKLSQKDFSYEILRRSIDARRNEKSYIYRLIIDTEKSIKLDKDISLYKGDIPLFIPKIKLPYRPVVIGLGPSGLFASLVLARSGNPPIILERGKPVEERIKDIELLRKGLSFNPNSNVCYGEGGAGAYSDGKLNTGVKSPFNRFVLEEFVSKGAPKDILYDFRPHIGSDLLPLVLKSFREELLSLGSDILFSTLFTSLEEKKDGSLRISYLDKDGITHYLSTKALFLAYGHSPYETAKMLQEKGLKFLPKPFSMGVRFEVLQKEIDDINYHKLNEKYSLPPSSFRSATHLANGRGVYSFCMCPGGEVVNSSSEEGSLVVNGMSKRARNEKNANAAILVDVKVDDYFKGNPLDGYLFREHYERRAFCKEKSYFAPFSTLSSFLNEDDKNSIKTVCPSYLPGVYPSLFNGLLPDFVLNSLKQGFPKLAKDQSWYKNGDAILTGIETRSSSPARIYRDSFGESNIKGLYPIGEGASFGGGITSSAIDGVKVVMSLLEKAKDTH